MEEKSTNITSNTTGDNSTVTTGRNVSSPVFGSYGSEIGCNGFNITILDTRQILPTALPVVWPAAALPCLMLPTKAQLQ